MEADVRALQQVHLKLPADPHDAQGRIVSPVPIIIPEGLKVPWGDSQVTLDDPALCKHVVPGTQDRRGRPGLVPG